MLQRLLSNISVTTGLNEDMLKVIQHRLENVKAIEKYCTLCVDEMALKSHLFYDRKTDKIVGLLDLADNTRNQLIPVPSL